MSSENTTYRYKIEVIWSVADQAFLVRVPELPGCMADGASYKEAVTNVEIIIEEWIATAHALNRHIPESAGKLMYA